MHAESKERRQVWFWLVAAVLALVLLLFVLRWTAMAQPVGLQR